MMEEDWFKDVEDGALQPGTKWKSEVGLSSRGQFLDLSQKLRTAKHQVYQKSSDTPRQHRVICSSPAFPSSQSVQLCSPQGREPHLAIQ
jgi:hypothetical protein